MDVETLLAEAEIRHVLYRYCRGIDRLDEDLVRSCYHADAIDSHGNFEGTVDEFMAWAFRMVRRYTLTMHFLGNIFVEVDEEAPDLARVETYAIAVHRREGGEAHHNITSGFRYVDRFARRPPEPGLPPEWRIEHRVVLSEWLLQDPPDGWWPIADSFLTGSRDRTDPVYLPIREL